MKTEYVFGDIGFVLSCEENIHVLYPVEVQFVGCTECFMFNELEFMGVEDEQ